MLVLCLDTATEDVAAAVAEVDDGSLVRSTRRVLRDARGAGEHLMPLATDAIAAAGVTMADLDAIAVGVGPGPYTGLRVGVMTAAALGRALRRPVYGACSLDLFATRDVVVTTDARRREIFWAAYGPDEERVEGPGVIAPALLAVRLGDTSDPLYGRAVVGPGAVRYAEVLAANAVGTHHSAPVERLALLVAARARAGAPGEIVQPIYLRHPDAVPAAAR